MGFMTLIQCYSHPKKGYLQKVHPPQCNQADDEAMPQKARESHHLPIAWRRAKNVSGTGGDHSGKYDPPHAV